jgi:hypothetical protein
LTCHPRANLSNRQSDIMVSRLRAHNDQNIDCPSRSCRGSM